MGNNDSKSGIDYKTMLIKSDSVLMSTQMNTEHKIDNKDTNQNIKDDYKVTSNVVKDVNPQKLTCRICRNTYMVDNIKKHKIAYKFVGVCQTCDIKNGTTYESTLNTKYSNKTRCEDCSRITDCCAYTEFKSTYICSSCVTMYLSDNNPKICLKGADKQCSVCKNHESIKDKCFYTEPTQKEFCLRCLIKKGMTKKQLIASNPEKIDSMYFDPLELDEKYAISGVKYDEWKCIDPSSGKCNHPKCSNCRGKHRFLCRMTVYENRVDMCSECWINFNKVAPKEPKKEEKC